MAKKQSTANYRCPIEASIDVFGGKWKAVILWWLSQRTHRTAELRRRIPDITEKVLAQQLQELEAEEIIARRVYDTVPPKEEYSLTEYGRTLKRPLAALCDWGKAHIERKSLALKSEDSPRELAVR